MYSSNLRNKLFIKLFIISNLTFISSNSLFALNLGRIITNSMFGEQLDADIALEDVPPELTEKQLQVKLSAEGDFRAVGLKKEPYHDDLGFKPYKDDASNWFIKVNSKKPITSQFVNFLVSLDWPEGHATREYMTIMKSPVGNQASAPAASTKNIGGGFALAVTQDNQKIVRAEPTSELYKDYESSDLFSQIIDDSEVQDVSSNNNNTTEAMMPAKAVDMSKVVIYKAEAKRNQKPVINKKLVKEALPAQVQSQPAAELQPNPIDNKQAASKLTKKGDTLSQIAERYAVANGMTRHQMIIAIYNSNKKAFIKDDVNRLRQNFKLDIPSATLAKEIVSNAPPLSIAPNVKAKFDKVKTESKLAGNKKTLAKPAEAKLSSSPELTAVAKPQVPAGLPAQGQLATPKQTIESQPVDVKAPQSSSLAANQAKDVVMPEVRKYEALPNIDSVSEELNVKDLSKFNTTKDDLAKTHKILRSKRLEIVTANEQAENTPTDNYLLSAEKLVAKQKENQELKEQLYLMQAQLKDLQKAVALHQATNQSASNNNSEMVEQSIPLGVQVGDKLGKNSLSSFISNVSAKVSDQQKMVRASITDYLGLYKLSLGKFGHKLSSGEVKSIFYIWTSVGAGILCLTAMVAYLIRRRRKAVISLDVDTHDDILMAENQMPIVLNSDELLEEKFYEYEIVDEKKIGSEHLIDELNDLIIQDDSHSKQKTTEPT